MSVTIVPYRPEWSAEFYAVARALRIALGDSALRIDHIGSTAVPGLAAKDRIDVQVCVTELSSVDAVEPRLKSVGYEARPDISHDHVPANMIENTGDWEKRFFTSGPRNRPTNIHMRRLGAAHQRYALLFRDYLRAHPTSAAAYGELKRRLAAQLPDLLTYTDVKDPACDLIMIAAEDWASWQGWTPGPSDR